jgi:hypothetical protein
MVSILQKPSSKIPTVSSQLLGPAIVLGRDQCLRMRNSEIQVGVLQLHRVGALSNLVRI